ncbi:MAG TPA: ABC transporter ATP-binding protein [Candidatus Methylacidiphilales bacterium]|nr:ABC transporter ATP-binding protein [Candidatus Methylacidiphilales bacterium]
MIRVENATKLYGRAGANGAAVHALNGVNLRIEAGEFVAIMGPSGCGKSTLLHVLGGLDVLSSGEIYLDDEPVHRLDEAGLTRLRRRKIGFVFQFFNLLPTLTVEENVRLPGLLQNLPEKEIERRARALLEAVGMEHRAGHRLHQLSGGEMQRTALARALLMEPKVLLADEPTGNLDSEASIRVVNLFREIGERHRATIVMVTHSREVANAAHRVVTMRDGRVEE